MSEAVASGKHRYELDKLIGFQVIFGVLIIVCGGYSTIPVGAGLLALTIWLRRIV